MGERERAHIVVQPRRISYIYLLQRNAPVHIIVIVATYCSTLNSFGFLAWSVMESGRVQSRGECVACVRRERRARESPEEREERPSRRRNAARRQTAEQRHSLPAVLYSCMYV